MVKNINKISPNNNPVNSSNCMNKGIEMIVVCFTFFSYYTEASLDE